MTRFVHWLLCLIGDHDWTCAAEQGIPPTKEQAEGGLAGFYSYATGYCKRCKKVMV